VMPLEEILQISLDDATSSLTICVYITNL